MENKWMTMTMDEENHRNRFRTKIIMITNIVRKQDQIVGGKKRKKGSLESILLVLGSRPALFTSIFSLDPLQLV